MYKKFISLLLVLSMISLVCTPALALEYSDGYDASLSLAGLSHDDYLSMSAETREIYSHMQLRNTQFETKYYRIISFSSSNAASTYSCEVGSASGMFFIEEITENAYLQEIASYHYNIDGYGHFAMPETANSYSMSFGASGADFSVSPSAYVSTMNNTHAQLTY